MQSVRVVRTQAWPLRTASLRALLWLGCVAAIGCAPASRVEPFRGRVELVLLHTADIHSQLFPWSAPISASDERRGLGRAGTWTSVGGFARLATLVQEERARASRVIHLDSGDLFQGSLVFEAFRGEPEVLAFDALGVDAQALGNHELDHGAGLVRERYGRLATFPLLAVNYALEPGGVPASIGEDGLRGLVDPFVVLDAGGLRVGVIGVGNVRSVSALRTRPNELGAVALEATAAVQGAIDGLRPVVDVIVAATHLGLDADEALVRGTSGIDVVLGGHQHIVLDEPEWVTDCAGSRVRDAWGSERACVPRRVPIVHSGAYGKYLGRLEVALDDNPALLEPSYEPLDRHEVTDLVLSLLPVQLAVAEEPWMAAMLESYRAPVGAPIELFGVGFAPEPVERNGATGGDSPLGNFVADAARRLAGADTAVLGASSLRHDLPPGLLDAETLTRVLPFDDALVRVRITGAELAAVFERAARSASARDCRSQVQVAGVAVRFTCPCDEENQPGTPAAACARAFSGETDLPCEDDGDCALFSGICAGEPGRCFAPAPSEASYELVTTSYLASGGSALFDPVSPTEQRPAGDGVLEAVFDALRETPPCSEGTESKGDFEEAGSDAPDTDDARDDDSACAGACAAAVVRRAREDCERVGWGGACPDGASLCEIARSVCARLPCVDERAGASRDGRIRFEAP